MLRTEILQLLLALFVLVVAVRCVWRCCSLPRGRRSAAGPACGRCGYPAAAQTRCSECGSEISHVGLATPWLVLRLGPGLLVGALSLALLLGIVWVVGLEIGKQLERTYTGTTNPARPPRLVRATRTSNVQLTNLVSTPPDIPLAAAVYEDFTHDQSSFPPPWKTVEGAVIIAVFDPASRPDNPAGTVEGFRADVPNLRIDTVAPRFQAFDARGRLLSHGAQPGKADAAALVASTGIDLANPINAEAADRLADLIVLAAAKVDNGGWGQGWIDAAFQNQLVFGAQTPGARPTVQLAITGGTSAQSSVKPSTRSILPPRPVWPTVWRAVWASICLLAGAYVLWIMAARRRRLMRPAAS
ncbi:MAG: hypothetical protein IT438_04970 [Phycisphaerales bacterium]|nr:hypothetical protein [Phycisphaerales bacterium]